MKRILIAILMVLILSNIAYAAKPNIGADQLRLDSGLIDTDGSLKVYSKSEVDTKISGNSGIAATISGTEQTIEVTYTTNLTAGTFAGVYNDAGILKASNKEIKSTLFTNYSVDTTTSNLYDLGMLVVGTTVFTFIRDSTGGISYKAYSYTNNTLILQTNLTQLFTNVTIGACAIRQLDSANIFISYTSAHSGTIKTYYRTVSFSEYTISSPSSETLLSDTGRDVAAELFGNDLVLVYDKNLAPYYQVLTWGGVSFTAKVSETSIANHTTAAAKLDSVKIDSTDIFLFTTDNNNIVSYTVYTYNGSNITRVIDTTTLSTAPNTVYQITSVLVDSTHIFIAYDKINDTKYQILEYINDTVTVTVSETQILNNSYTAISSGIIDTTDLLLMFVDGDTLHTNINAYANILSINSYLYPCYIKNSGIATNTTEVILAGNITLSGLTPDTKYYLQSNFTLSNLPVDCGLFLENSTTGECNIGLATSSTNLLMIPSFK
jgi:hypothetical protein